MAASSNFVKSEAQIRMDVKKELHNELHNVFVCQNCEEVPKAYMATWIEQGRTPPKKKKKCPSLSLSSGFPIFF
jgi:NAD-dependent dihydropyrimidine dehydrogenase PreA subunit